MLRFLLYGRYLCFSCLDLFLCSANKSSSVRWVLFEVRPEGEKKAFMSISLVSLEEPSSRQVPIDFCADEGRCGPCTFVPLYLFFLVILVVNVVCVRDPIASTGVSYFPGAFFWRVHFFYVSHTSSFLYVCVSDGFDRLLREA